MEICSHDKCSGCNSCVNACPHGCISMEEDALGVMHPVIDEHRCVHCNLCVRSCPNNVELEFNYPLKCYASWVTDKEKRRICASGGIGTALSEYVIRHGGVVFGSRYDDKMFPVMSYAETLDELECYKGSRYVQSVVGGDTFHKVKHFLVNDRLVLFVGTPCQVAGLKTFLKKDFNNLITVDLICHGVCPTRYFVDEVEYLKQRYRINSLGDVRFRGNDGNNFRLSLWGKNGRRLFPRSGIFEKIFRIDEAQQFYIWGFLMGVSMRENCYSCKFSRPERISDVTIGDFIGIVGQTGSSKTTLINLLLRFYDVSDGEILIDGNNIKNYSLHELRKNIAVSFQNPFLFNDTVKNNIKWGKKDATDEEVYRAAKIACCYDFITKDLKDGFDTMISEGGTNLSGGQRQRVCLARAILLHPKILILDDSFSALDRLTETKVKENLKRECSDITKIVISQKISTIKDCDNIIVLEKGHITHIGTHSYLNDVDEIYKDINAIQNEGL